MTDRGPQPAAAERGLRFDSVAAEYDRVRLGYPAEIVDAACGIGGLAPGSRVLEIGCGTGKLTEALAARELRLDAVDPGERMIAVARQRVGDAAGVRFRAGRFEDVELPEGAFAAAFSATAFHWVEAAVGWAKVARLLRPDGVFCLLTHVGFSPLDEQLHAVWTDVRPESKEWVPRDERTFLDGVEARLGNVSEVWAWVNQRDALARPEAAGLFTDTRLTTAVSDERETAEHHVAVMRTTSMYLGLDASGRRRLEKGLTAVIEDAGGSLPVRLYALLVTARAAPR
ncbi:MAG TPA: class I SAM-dependent methyltransferase [Gaiellaceae bacterium]|nr:class I SAM-dependent methyltransferase [Gaiellaceae bacterium]